MNFINIEITQLKNAKYNPRKDLQPSDNEYQKIKKSIEEFGYVEPIIVNSDFTIIGGHQRVKVLKDLGYKKIECILIDVDKTKEKALNIALNKITGEWDEIKLKELLNELDDLDYNVELTGFDYEYLDKVLKIEEDLAEDDFDVQEAYNKIEEPKTKYGDIYQLGKHTLMCGDVTKDLDKLVKDEEVDLIVTDPPYNVDVVNSQGMKIKNDNLSNDNFQKLLDGAFKNYGKKLKSGGVFYIWYADKEAINFRTICEKNGLSIKQTLIWVKNHFNFGRQDYKWKHEPCLYGWKEGSSHYFIELYNNPTVIQNELDINKMTKEELKDLLLKYNEYPQSTIECDKPLINIDHPTMKPIKLIGELIRNSSKRNEIVLDGFGGSGTTLLACEELDRKCLMMELDPKYCDVIIARYEKMTGEKAKILKKEEKYV